MSNSKTFKNAELVSRANSLPSTQRQKFFYLCIKAAVVGVAKNSHEITALVEEFGIPLYQVLDLLGLFIDISEIFMQNHRNRFEELLNSVGFSEDFIKSLPFQDAHPVSVLLNPNNGTENLSSFNWRVDISFSCGYQGALHQRMPSILITIGITNGSKYIIELDLRKFARLRFFISFIIKEFNKAKKQPLLKSN